MILRARASVVADLRPRWRDVMARRRSGGSRGLYAVARRMARVERDGLHGARRRDDAHERPEQIPHKTHSSPRACFAPQPPL